MTPPLWQKVKRNKRASWWNWKRRVKKAGLKLSIQKEKIMASSPIILWENNGNGDRLYFLVLQNHSRWWHDWYHEIKRHLLLGRKAMTNLDSILKSRDITLPTKVHLIKAMVFPIAMYGCESWTIKKAEHWIMVLLNCGVGEDSWEFLEQQGNQTSQS